MRYGTDPIRRTLLGGALLAASITFLYFVHPHYAIQQWLFWRYLRAIACAVFWACGCTSLGLVLLDRLRVRSELAADAFALAFPLGVLSFQLTFFLLGIAHLLGPFTFFALPALFLLAGASRLWDTLTRLRQSVMPRTLADLAVLLFGVVAIAIVYFQLLTPEPFSWDARWYHLPIAQQYALWGAVKPFPEGWWLAAYPHSASLTYAWAFLMPKTSLFDRLELCAHLELLVFLGTIAGIPTLVRALAPGLSGRHAWAALFLFPAIYLYDGNLHVGADHMAAVFCIPVALTLIRLWHSWNLLNALLFAAFFAAGLLSKYSAWAMLVFPAILFVARGTYLSLRRPGAVRVLLAGGAAVLLLSAPHWLKNWLWYGDPMYPVFYQKLAVHPWSAEAPHQFRTFMTFTTPPRPGWDGVIDGLLATLTFSFKTTDWFVFHHDVPIFGSLFTLTLMCLPFVRSSVRLWLAYAGGMVAIFVWYMSNHQDRLLQAWLPLMAAVTATTLQLMWVQGRWIVRTSVSALVALQIIWGADVPFYPTHGILNDSPIRVTSQFLASGFNKVGNRLRAYGDYGAIGEFVPRDSVLLLHDINLQVGFDALVVNDLWQGRIDYGALLSPRAIHHELGELGVTHLVWKTAGMSGWQSIASNLAFLRFALNFGEHRKTFGEWSLAVFPRTVPAPVFGDRVVVSTCNDQYRRGIYPLAKLNFVTPGTDAPPPDAELGALEDAAAKADFMVVDPNCTQLPDRITQLFHPAVAREGLRLYVRAAR